MQSDLLGRLGAASQTRGRTANALALCFLLIAASIMAARKPALSDGRKLCLHRNANSGAGSSAEKRGASAGPAISPKMATQTPAFVRGLRDVRLTLGDLKSEGAIAALSSVVMRIVFEPELMKSISSLSPRFSLTRPSPNEACSIQS